MGTFQETQEPHVSSEPPGISNLAHRGGLRERDLELQGAGVGCVSHFFRCCDKTQDKGLPRRFAWARSLRPQSIMASSVRCQVTLRLKSENREMDADTQLTFFFLSSPGP